MWHLLKCCIRGTVMRSSEGEKKPNLILNKSNRSYLWDIQKSYVMKSEGDQPGLRLSGGNC